MSSAEQPSTTAESTVSIDDLAAHGHSHGHGGDGTRVTRRTRGLLAALLVPLVLFSAIGAAFLWPSGEQQKTAAFGADTALVNATVDAVVVSECQPGVPAAGNCMNVEATQTEGEFRGTQFTLNLPEGPGQVGLDAGDEIIVGRTEINGTATYYFSDLQRGNGLLILAAVFAVFVVGIARWRGLGALVGLVVTFAVITLFLLPSILDGNSPVLVTLVGSAAIVLVVLYIAHGLNARTTTAIIGTLLSLIIVGAFSTFAVDLANITGLSSEEVSYVQSFAQGVDIRGLLLGGIILGALGVLNDMTVSQASSVWEINRAAPSTSRRDLYRGGMRVGRDHIASTIYTLVLAYTGASLPLLIIFVLSDRSLGSIFTSDIVGEEIVRSIVGSIGLMLSVPLTTALAAIVVKGQREKTTRRDPDAPGDVHQPEPLSAPGDLNLGTDIYAAEADAIEHGEEEDRRKEERRAAAAGAAVEPPVEPLAEERRKNERRSLRRQRNTTFEPNRKMSRRERKFWEED